MDRWMDHVTGYVAPESAMRTARMFQMHALWCVDHRLLFLASFEGPDFGQQWAVKSFQYISAQLRCKSSPRFSCCPANPCNSSVVPTSGHS